MAHPEIPNEGGGSKGRGAEGNKGGESKGHGSEGHESKGHGSEGGGSGGSGSTATTTEDLSSVTTVEETTQRYKLTWLEKLMQGYNEGAKRGVFPPIEGALNLIVTGVLESARGSLKGLEPAVQSVYVTPIPTLRIILAASKIKICGPQTHLEFLLNHVICFVNGPLYLGLAASPIPICIKGREVQCYGPFLRLPDTLTPEMVDSGKMGLDDGAWLGNVQLEQVDESGDTVGKSPVEATGGGPPGPDSHL